MRLFSVGLIVCLSMLVTSAVSAEPVADGFNRVAAQNGTKLVQMGVGSEGVDDTFEVSEAVVSEMTRQAMEPQSRRPKEPKKQKKRRVRWETILL